MNVQVVEKGLALSDELRRLRLKAGLSQEQLAYKAGVTVGVVTKLERGSVDDPQWSTIRKIARILGANLNELATATDEPSEDAPQKPGRPKKGRP